MIIDDNDMLTEIEYEDLIAVLEESNSAVDVEASEDDTWTPIIDKLQRQFNALIEKLAMEESNG